MKHLSWLLAITTLTCLVTACGGNDSDTPKTQTAQPTQNTAQTQTTPVATPASATTETKPNKEIEQDKKTELNKETELPSEKTDDNNTAVAVKPLSIAEGKVRYETTCKICHDQGLLDAPKLSDKANWAKRLEQGIDTLHLHSAKGFNKMPAQATGDISEAEVYAAVDYMVSQVK